MEFAKAIKGGAKKTDKHRKALIEIEEAKEDKICKGSQASEFIKEHKKGKTKKKKAQHDTTDAKPEEAGQEITEVPGGAVVAEKANPVRGSLQTQVDEDR